LNKRLDFEVGDIVKIMARSHPASGQLGRVTVAPRMVSVLGNPKRVWMEVEILEWAGHTCGVQPGQAMIVTKGGE
jgi:hypothetical protein